MCISDRLYTTLHLEPAKKNIVMLHGQIAAAAEMDKINLSKLRNKHIDYLALGHVHSYSEGSLDERGRYAYCGCLEGRGFDEIGEKGFVLLDIGDKTESRFIPNSYRKIEAVSVDISGADGIYNAYQRVAEQLQYPKEDMLRIYLTGELSFDNDGLAKEVERLLSPRFYFVSVKDKTLRKFDVDALTGDISLRGEFIRTVLAGQEYTDEQKQKIISVGLKALRDGD
ncbi:MAG: DNA repair exonuclease, partial [Lachnospiraceae bacterium]|nr:DNA repair exonuclease [Lachnospiraceae bacterium]